MPRAETILSHLRPEFILALAPLAELAISLFLRRVFRSSTLNSLNLAAANDTRVLIKAVAKNEAAAESFVAYIDNNSDLERCFEILVFGTLSLIVWGVSAGSACMDQYIFGYIFLWVALVLILLILVLRFWPGKTKDKFAAKGATSKYFKAAVVFNLLIIGFEIVTKEFLCTPH